MTYQYLQRDDGEEKKKQEQFVIEKALEIAERAYNQKIDDILSWTIYKVITENCVFTCSLMVKSLVPGMSLFF